jgi:hypothetical protein
MNEIEREKGGARRRNAQEWAQRLQQFEASGQQAKEFCRGQGLALSTFSYWRRRLRRKAEVRTAEKLVEVRPAAVRVGLSSCAMRIALQGGIWMEIDEGTEAGWVAGVVRALAARES